MERYYTAFLELLDIGDGPPLTEEGVLDTARTWIWWADEGGNEYRLNVPGVWAATKQVDRLLALADEAAATDDMPVAVLYGYEPDEVVIAPGGETQQISTGLLLADAQPGLDNLVRPIKLVRWETIGSLRKYLRMQVGEEYGPNVFLYHNVRRISGGAYLGQNHRAQKRAQPPSIHAGPKTGKGDRQCLLRNVAAPG